MSRVNDLMAALAPEGIKYFELQELFETRNGYTPAKSNASLWTDGTVPWFRMEDLRENGGVLNFAIQRIPEIAVKNGRLFPANSILVATSATIGEHALVTVRHLSNQRFTSLALKPKYVDLLDMKFAYYYGFVLDEWCRNNTTTSSFASVDMSGFKKFRFPVPPLEVQREIVRILDEFTLLETKLEAELEARRQQYAFYRESLLTSAADECRQIPMGQLGKFIRGRRFTKADIVPDGIPSIHYGEIYTHYGVATSSTISHVREEMADRLCFAEQGDVVIAAVGETVEDVGKAVAWLGHDRVAIHDDTFLFRGNLNPKFVSYYLQTEEFHSQKNKYVARAKVKRLAGPSLAKILIPVLSLPEQERIVAVLDKFDAFLNDLSVGLPAELTARRKQYEYYRDRLLTFEEAPA
ncbi:restriction endonuclease subunit S [Micrococcaceae bacterium RIT802]|nr:restriction endonuclease subunit S [Micrococcaceae bacterium RIT 802]